MTSGIDGPVYLWDQRFSGSGSAQTNGQRALRLLSTVVEVSVKTMAPEDSGGYMQVRRLVSPDGTRFGDRLWINLQAIGEDQVNIDDPNSESLSTSVGFLLPNPSNRPLNNHQSEFSQHSVTHPPGNNPTESSVDSQQPQEDLAPASSEFDSVDQPSSSSNLSSATDFDDLSGSGPFRRGSEYRVG
ncbi:hypothetical protein PGTUg99_002892 [Puccinia graminis f. sp. tritici]|uniref:Nbr1 FW domain-containing protein n=1 Tax=Puccinia graminis f. sp. tritici TaxID=56615 RepID=A0A5B0S4J3_PUCGR|nr:hypothetical protein PGTUg99_002892 [Puccinia graminis f. sp. tritici]